MNLNNFHNEKQKTKRMAKIRFKKFKSILLEIKLWFLAEH